MMPAWLQEITTFKSMLDEAEVADGRHRPIPSWANNEQLPPQSYSMKQLGFDLKTPYG